MSYKLKLITHEMELAEKRLAKIYIPKNRN